MSGPAAPPLGRRLALASFHAVLQRVILRGLGLVSTLILVRLLSPEDFGIVGVAAVVQTMLDGLTATGFGLALVRMRDPQSVHYDTAFTLTVARGVAIAVALVATADLHAAFMGEPRIAPVMWVLGLTAIMQSLENIRLADLQRDLRFDVLLRYEVLKKVASFAATVPLAVWLQNYWALVLGAPLARLLVTPVSYWLVPYRPRLSVAVWREFFHFSKWLILGNLVMILDGQAMNVVVGRFVGMAMVGLYQVSYQIAALPISEIAAPIRGPAYAGFARVQHEPRALRHYMLQGLALQWIVLLPLSAGIALTAREVTLLFLGTRWLALVPLMPLVGLFALFDAVRDYLANIFIVLERQRRLVLTYAVLMSVRIGLIVWGTSLWGLYGAAWAMLATSVVNAGLWLAMAGRLIGLDPTALRSALWRPAIAASLMAAAVAAVPDTLVPFAIRMGVMPVVVALLAKVALGAVVYCGSILVLWRVAGRHADAAETHLLRLFANAGSSIIGRRGSKRS